MPRNTLETEATGTDDGGFALEFYREGGQLRCRGRLRVTAPGREARYELIDYPANAVSEAAAGITNAERNTFLLAHYAAVKAALGF